MKIDKDVMREIISELDPDVFAFDSSLKSAREYEVLYGVNGFCGEIIICGKDGISWKELIEGFTGNRIEYKSIKYDKLIKKILERDLGDNRVEIMSILLSGEDNDA